MIDGKRQFKTKRVGRPAWLDRLPVTQEAAASSPVAPTISMHNKI